MSLAGKHCAAIWARGEIVAALSALLREMGIKSTETVTIPGPTVASYAGASPGPLVSYLAQRHELEAEPIRTSAAGRAATIAECLPALLWCPERGYLAAIRARRNRLEVATKTRTLWLPISSVLQLLETPDERSHRKQLNDLAEQAGLAGDSSRYEDSTRPILIGWSLRPQASKGIGSFLRPTGAFQNIAVLLISHLLQYSLLLGSWWVLGKLSFAGHVDKGWLWGWALLLLSIVPLRVLQTYAQGVLAIGVGAALKRQLLRGTLRLRPDQVRKAGTGDALSQLFESESVEAMALSGAVEGCLALLELGIAALVLGPLAYLLAVVCVVLLFIGRRFWKIYDQWTSTRMQMTRELVEVMVGQRTRLAQEKPEERHAEEDMLLDRFMDTSVVIDRCGASLVAVLPRCWLIAGLICLAPTAISGLAATSTLAVRLGGVLLAWTALQKLSSAAVEIAGTLVAAIRIAPLFRAAGESELVGAAAPEAAAPDVSAQVLADKESPHAEPILALDGVQFRYQERAVEALHRTNLSVRSGDRILIEGPSGGGKSTFAAVLSGLRPPSAGILLAGGLDRQTLGEAGWRQRVVYAPQYHDNHILTETLACNLLMGREWPPSPQDLQEAEILCRDLGLGELINRMPAGLHQVLGEGGWQVSQGERSRIFLARALLQRADLTILDESFGALDPENLRAAVECALDRTDALMVIAHP